MESFTAFFRDSQLPDWKSWYVNLDSLKATARAVLSPPSTAHRQHHTHGDPDAETMVALSDLHRAALDRLRQTGARVRIGCDLWLDENSTPTIQAGDHWIASPRDRANVNVLLFPRNGKVRLNPRRDGNPVTLPRRSSFNNEPLSEMTERGPSPVSVQVAVPSLPVVLQRNGLEVHLSLWPRTSNGLTVDLNAIQDAFRTFGEYEPASTTLAATHEDFTSVTRADSMLFDTTLTAAGGGSLTARPDMDGAAASSRTVAHTVQSRHGLWIITVDAKQLGDERSDAGALQLYVLTLGVEDSIRDFDLVADVYAALGRLWTRELRKVSRFYCRQAGLVAASVAACVETSKSADRQTAKERQRLTLGFRDTLSALDALTHFRDLNSVAVFRSLDDLERLTGHDIMSSLGRQLRRVSFMAKDADGQSALNRLREMLVSAAAPYCPPSSTVGTYLQNGSDGSQEFRRKRNRYNVQLGTMFGLSAALLLATAVDFFEQPQPFIVNNNGGALASYHFTITLGLIFMYAVVAGVVEACEHMSVNYVFLFELDSSDHWTGRELLRNVMVYLTLWLACLYGFVRTAKAEFRGDVNSGWAWVWSYIVWGCMIVTWIAYQVLHPSTRKRWFLDTLLHVVTAPLNPVRFQDFVIGLMLMSSAEILNQFQLIWCNVQIPGMGWDCSVASSLKLYVLAALPPIWRTMQCIRCYLAPLPHRRTAFPHLFNASKYVMGMVVSTLAMGYKLQGRFNPSDSQGYDALFYAYIAVSIVNATFRSFWDFFVNGAFIPAVNIVETDRRRHERMASLFGSDQIHVGSEGYVELALAVKTPKRLSVDDDTDNDEKMPSPLTSAKKKTWPPSDAEELCQHPDAVHLDEHHDFLCGWPWWPIRRTHLATRTYATIFAYNVFARFWWVFSVFYTASVLWSSLIVIVVELLRRFAILCVRIEVEQVANVENFKVTVAAPPPTAQRLANPIQGLLSTTAWDSAAGEIALSAHDALAEHVLVNSSQVDRFFSLLPAEEKVAVMQLTLPYLPSTRKFDGRAGEGKARWFAERPPDVKVLALLQRAGQRSLTQYAHDCTKS